MTEQAPERISIHAPVERVFAVLSDFERYPEWAGDLKSARIVDRDADGRALQVEFRAAAMGRSTTYTLAYDYTDAPRKLGWHLVDGDLQRELDGSYQLTPAADHPGRTEVLYELSIDLMVPIPGVVKRRAEGRIVRTALEDLRRRVESGD